MQACLRVLAICLFLPLTPITHAQSPAIDLTQFGYAKTMSGRFAAPAFASLSYVGDDALFVTFPADSNSHFDTSGDPLNYTGLVVSRAGIRLGEVELSGRYRDVLQQRINIQPVSNVLVQVADQLRVYDLDLANFRSIDLPERAQLKLPPDRKTVVAISQDGNKAMDTIVGLKDASSHVDHLDFDERAVRDAQIAVSNDGSGAHAVRDPDGELAVHSWSLRWPAFKVGKYQAPLAFTNGDELLVSAMATTPFPPSELYLWKQTGEITKIRRSKTGIYSAAQSSLDGQRVLLTETNVNDFLALLAGGDCGPCGESYYYSLVDVPTARVLFKHKRGWNCTEALSPSGQEIAELCDGIVRFYHFSR